MCVRTRVDPFVRTCVCVCAVVMARVFCLHRVVVLATQSSIVIMHAHQTAY